jgi:Asp-tRNA(Asn)/Glu-tRNA(Gln) amidotransferase A subunit family amidase
MNRNHAAISFMVLTLSMGAASSYAQQFHVEEKSITDIQSAIKSGQTSCKQVVQAYLDRAKAYNGSCTALLTKDGAPVAQSTGMVRAGSLLKYPTQTVAASTVFPDLDQYQGLPIEFGKMDTSISDPSVQLQYGLRVGIPEAGQLSALETLNIRGERSVTCKGEFDKAPSAGPLPAGAPAVCEEFRKMPDALERAEELDKEYGRKPDLAKLPMYCAVFSLKDWYDAKDMRGTGGNDVNFAFDVPKYDSPNIATLREKGAIIFAVASANNVGPASAPGPNKAVSVVPDTDLQYAPWSGQACNPYDTARVPRGTSNGSGVSVAANMVTCSICEQGTASCQGPASRNNISLLITTKGVIMNGGITGKKPGDRAGIHCKTIKDSALVLDAIKGFTDEDEYTALPKGLVPKEPFTSFLVKDSEVKDKPLKGVRVAIAREFMVKDTKNDVAISDQIDKEIKDVLRDKLGATLVETYDPLYPDDPSVPTVKYTFQDAMAEVFPHTVPEYFFRKDKNGKLMYTVPGWDVTTLAYDIALSRHEAPLSPLINLRSISQGGLSNPSPLFNMNKYLADRGDARVKDADSWFANAKFKTDAERAGAQNAVGKTDPRPGNEGVSYLEMQAVFRMILLKVMQKNNIDVFVNPEQTTPPYLLGGAPEPEINNRASISCCTAFTALLGAPEAVVPAGYTTVTYDPKYVLSADKKSYVPVTGDVQSKLPHPMAISLMIWSGPGSDSDVVKVASAYEAATHHRIPPPSFGPVPAGGAKAQNSAGQDKPVAGGAGGTH